MLPDSAADSHCSAGAASITISTINLIIITLTSVPAGPHTGSMADRLIIFDTTLRDGEQAPGFSMGVDAKLRLARQLETLGVDILEAGFPMASEADAEAVRRIALALERPVIAALARCAPGDVDRAAWSIAPARRSRIHTFIATSDLHLQRKLRISREDCVRHCASAFVHGRRGVLGRGRDPQRHGLPVSCRRGSD